MQEQNQNLAQKRSVFFSLWLWWVLVTAIYIFLYVYYVMVYETSTVGPTPLGYIAGFVGLFVPYGLLSLMAFVTPLSWVSAVVFIFLMAKCNQVLNKKNFSLGKRIIYNLLVLLVVTFFVDAIRGTFVESWSIFFSGTLPINNFGSGVF